MKESTRRFLALLCVFCMLFTSIPSSVLSDPAPATPTDLLPVEEETEEQAAQEKPKADCELVLSEDQTITGELEGEHPKPYLIRVSTYNETMRLNLILTTEGELEAVITDE